VDDLPVAHVDAHVAVVVAGVGAEVARLGLRLRDDAAAEAVSLRGLAGPLRPGLVVRVVHQPGAVEAAGRRGAAPGVADADLRAGRIDDRLSVHVRSRRAAAAGVRGDAHVAGQRVPGLGADDAVHADPGGGLQGAHGAR